MIAVLITVTYISGICNHKMTGGQKW